MFLNLIPQVLAAESAWTDECVYTYNDLGVEANVATLKGVECLFRNLIKPAPALLAVVAVGMVIFAGIRLLMAGSDPKAYAAAWKTFTWAIIGLILLSAAWLIIILIERFTGANLSTFTVTGS
ncbi:MAG TPA: pilin [Candidatus Woesebacteria bacterium]|nr:pilin [Candidatus Woesebacteria bacterium]